MTTAAISRYSSSPPEADRLRRIFMPVTPASPRNSAYIDQAKAVRTPRLTSVSIVAAPWRRFTQAARWNGHAPQTTTGVASCRASHCQLSNCRAETIDSSRTTSASGAQISSRRRSGAVSSGSAGAVAPAASSAVGSAASYPAARTAASSCSGSTAPASNATAAFSVA